MVFTFQIQLEKIRSAENEVRWQHEEDVEDCSNCKGAFTVTKRKVGVCTSAHVTLAMTITQLATSHIPP